MSRTPTDLRAAAQHPAYTPSVADVPALIALVAEDEEAGDLERALVRQPEAAARAAAAALAGAVAPGRARLVHLLGRLAADLPALVPTLSGLVADADPKASRLALVALGKLPGPEAQATVLGAVAAPRSPAHLRAAVEALGKLGGPEALPALARLPAGDAELDRIAARARLRLERTARRGAPSGIDLAATLPAPVPLVLSCRAGLEGLLADELGGAAAGFTPAGPGRVAGRTAGPLADLFNRARTFLDLGFPVPITSEDAAGLSAALAGPGPRELLRRFTRGAIRYRLAFAGGGHRRSLVQEVATRTAALAPELTNDPTASTWEVEVEPGQLVLHPRRLVDPRFTYRRRDVPAASHPTLAAALARLGGARPDDVVWDPFVGSATELIERARLGPARRLVGGDRDPEALAAARENLLAAGVRAELVQREALGGAPPGVTLVLTNPPMGRRVARPDLGRFVDHVGAALQDGGRLAWISPVPQVTRDHARRAGLHPLFLQVVDMGGFTAEIQVFEKRGATSRPPPPSTSARPRSRA